MEAKLCIDVVFVSVCVCVCVCTHCFAGVLRPQMFGLMELCFRIWTGLQGRTVCRPWSKNKRNKGPDDGTDDGTDYQNNQ